MFPDNRRFGVLWMGRDALADAFDMRAAFNDLTLTVARGTAIAAVIDDVDHLLSHYGGLGAYGRADQVSHQFLDGEIEETQVTSVLLPAIFLGVTAFLLHIVLSRLVGTQRDQIATLKAFGYGNATVGVHYLELALMPVVAGSALGTVVGLWMADQLSAVYARFFQFPSADFVPDWRVVAAATAIGVRCRNPRRALGCRPVRLAGTRRGHARRGPGAVSARDARAVPRVPPRSHRPCTSSRAISSGGRSRHCSRLWDWHWPLGSWSRRAPSSTRSTT